MNYSLDSIVALKAGSEQRALLEHHASYRAGGILCHLVSTDLPHYVHVKVPVAQESGNWGDLFFPHECVGFVGSATPQGKIVGFDPKA